jgi:hypothetical protein
MHSLPGFDSGNSLCAGTQDKLAEGPPAGSYSSTSPFFCHRRPTSKSKSDSDRNSSSVRPPHPPPSGPGAIARSWACRGLWLGPPIDGSWIDP